MIFFIVFKVSEIVVSEAADLVEVDITVVTRDIPVMVEVAADSMAMEVVAMEVKEADMVAD